MGIHSPKHIKTVLTSQSCSNKPEILYRSYFKHGLFLENDEKYKEQRKAVNPAFSPGALRSYNPIINKKVTKFLETFEDHVEMSKVIDFKIYSQDLALNTVIKTMFGVDDIDREDRMDIVKGIDEFLTDLTGRLSKKMYNPLLMFDCFYKLTESYQKEKKFRSLFYNFVDRLLLKEGHERTHNLFIDHFYTNCGSMTHEEMQENLAIFLVGGFETTGTVIAAVLLLLAMNPEAQERVFEEAKDVVGSEDNEVDETKMNEMKYLERVIKESLRLFPVALLQARTSKVEIQLDNHKVPPGTIFLFEPLITHTNKDLWGPDADKFDPDRFLDENFSKIPPFAYFPFSFGPRICIAHRYAWNVMRIFLSRFILKYHVTTELKYEELKFTMRMTGSIKQGFMIKIHRR